ncbi:hypothetical protein MMC25_004461 [Agyrium rufum]|nr:hypothetical protein [Agyrium rufum]
MLGVASAAEPVVNISAGALQGGTCNSSSAHAFLSIPFAQPPLGDLRFAPPQAPNQTFSGGTYDARRSAPTCVQFGNEFVEYGLYTSEDCLYLDIWTPANISSSSALPVKVWVYGGSEDAGSISDPLYNGCRLAAVGDAIVVSINYRLGPLGWLTLPDAGIGGNFGIQDILMGLEWVQTNIAAFGGDPGKVLLFGQSAGAANVFVVSTLPQANQLINAVAMESGGGRSYASSDRAIAYSSAFAALVNCSASDASCFRSASTDTLNIPVPSEETDIAVNYGFGYDGWLPYVDGKIIPVDPGQVSVQVPAIFGTNSEDGTLFIAAAMDNNISRIEETSSADYTKFLQSEFGVNASAVEKAFPLSDFPPQNEPWEAPFYLMSMVYTLVNYDCPAIRGLRNAEKNGTGVWTYQSTHVPTCPWTDTIPVQALGLLGAAHSSEIPLVFANTDHLPLPNGNCSFTSDERTLSAQFVAAYTSMAANGNASSSRLAWPEWTSKALEGVRFANSTSVLGLNSTVCELFDSIAASQSVNATSSGNSTGSTNASSTTSSTPASTATAGASSGAGDVTVSFLALLSSIFAGISVLL